MRRYLVVANRTLASGPVLAAIRDANAREPSRFHLLVPANPPGDHAWTEGEARTAAAARLTDTLAILREEGIEADGEVGDPNPLLAIEDALREREVDGIILSTLPAGVSRWLKLDLPHRLAARFPNIPMTHVIGEERLSPAG